MDMKKTIFLLSLALCVFSHVSAQKVQYESRYSDNGDGTFTNPFLWGDYPDVDIIRVGDDYYMICSTFCLTPGIPISHSKDLVNWEIIGYAYDTLIGNDVYDMKDGKTRYNGGSWAPCIRYHNGKFHIFYYDNLGYFVSCVSDKPEGPYTQTTLDYRLYDPGVLFDDDGKVYVAHGQNAVYVTEISPDFKEVVTPQRLVFSAFRGAWEGSHFYKRNGYYYICNTTGGTPGQEYILRSKNVYGPYEVKEVVNTDSNLSGCGLHQGGFVDLPNGESWFFLFQDRVPAGRTPWLFPVRWVDDWPVIEAGDNYGRIAPTQQKPLGDKVKVAATSFERSDEFNSDKLNLHWQWSHNPDNKKWSLEERPGFLRLHAIKADSWENARNTLVRRFIGPEMTAMTKVDISNLKDGDCAGICVWNKPYCYLGVEKIDGVTRFVWNNEDKDTVSGPEFRHKTIYLKVTGDNTSTARFWYSFDNKNWVRLGRDFTMKFSGATYLGNRFGLFCFHVGNNPGGYADFDYMRIESPVGPANQFNASDTIQFAFYDNEHNTKLSRIFQKNPTPEQEICFLDDRGWIQFNNINFGNNINKITLLLRKPEAAQCRLELRADSLDGDVIALCEIPSGEGGDQFREYSFPIKDIKGKRKIFFRYNSGNDDVKFHSFRFD